MDGLKPGKLIKYGFWFGLGLIIPMFLLFAVTTAVTMVAGPKLTASMMEEAFGGEGMIPDVTGKDVLEHLELGEYREVQRDKRLVLLGTVRNTGTVAANSVQVEAELFDADGAFVFECSEYIQKTIQPDESENFQVNCGCGEEGIPAYSSLTLRVVGAYGF